MKSHNIVFFFNMYIFVHYREHKTGRYTNMSDSEYNHFKLLRYDSKHSLVPHTTIREMSAKVKLSPSTIAKLEREDWHSATATSIKSYHDGEGVNASYEYLFGETETKNKKYYELGKLFPFDDTFYTHLEQLLALEEKDNHFIEYMLSTLIYNPQEAFVILTTIFNALYKIHTIQNDTRLSSSEKNAMIKTEEYIFNQSTIEYLENHVMPLLEKMFILKNSQLANEAEATQAELDEVDDIDIYPAPITITATSVSRAENE